MHKREREREREREIKRDREDRITCNFFYLDYEFRLMTYSLKYNFNLF